jgi:hypothetical protein
VTLSRISVRGRNDRFLPTTFPPLTLAAAGRSPRCRRSKPPLPPLEAPARSRRRRRSKPPLEAAVATRSRRLLPLRLWLRERLPRREQAPAEEEEPDQEEKPPALTTSPPRRPSFVRAYLPLLITQVLTEKFPLPLPLSPVSTLYHGKVGSSDCNIF